MRNDNAAAHNCVTGLLRQLTHDVFVGKTMEAESQDSVI